MTLDVRQASELMRLAQAGDQVAYAALLVQLTAAARAFARARLGSVPWIDDVVQETLLAVHGARHTYDPDRPFGPWFYAIATSRLIDVVRRERRRTSRELALEVVPETAGHPVTTRTEIDSEAIRAAVTSLPAAQREIVERLKFRDQTVREIATRLEMTESAVKVTAHRAYKTLRRLLGGRHE